MYSTCMHIQLLPQRHLILSRYGSKPKIDSFLSFSYDNLDDGELKLTKHSIYIFFLPMYVTMYCSVLLVRLGKAFINAANYARGWRLRS